MSDKEMTFFRVECLNGRWFYASTPMSFIEICKNIKADGHFVTPAAFVPYASIGAMYIVPAEEVAGAVADGNVAGMAVQGGVN